MRKYLIQELWPLLMAIVGVWWVFDGAGIALATTVLMLSLTTLVPVVLAIWYGSALSLAEQGEGKEGEGNG